MVTDHLFLALAHTEWDTFAALMRDFDVNPKTVVKTIGAQLRLIPPGDGREVAVDPATSPLGFLSQRVGTGQVRGEVMQELERRFPPEFRNRIDDVVLFEPLALDEVREIARRYLLGLADTLSVAGKTIRIDDDALELASQGYSLAYGARFLKRVIDERVKLPISARWREGAHFHVRVEHGEVTVDVSSAELVAA
jgi:ATP-dependent Clp protease ATP-binding subunit ClpA